jgi:hypothetical protein
MVEQAGSLENAFGRPAELRSPASARIRRKAILAWCSVAVELGVGLGRRVDDAVLCRFGKVYIGSGSVVYVGDDGSSLGSRGTL